MSTRETLNKSDSTRSNALTHGSESDTLRFIQRVPRNPMLLVLAGPNGSGKSTITQYFEKVGEYTNADDVVAATGMSNEDAVAFVDNRRYHAIEMKQDFTFETVLSSQYKMDILRKAKSEGYFIKCIFVLTLIRLPMLPE